jgi:hypothetical protein
MATKREQKRRNNEQHVETEETPKTPKTPERRAEPPAPPFWGTPWHERGLRSVWLPSWLHEWS